MTDPTPARENVDDDGVRPKPPPPPPPTARPEDPTPIPEDA